MKQTYFIIALLMFNFSIVNAQVGINTDNADPDASAMLDVKSTDKGLLVPRMTTTQRTTISNPANGLLVFDSTTGSFWFYTTTWTELKGGTSKEIADADNDTKIQVEENADEDKIRFDVGGTEIGFLDNKTFHLDAPGQSLFIGKDAGQNDDGSDNKNVAIGYEAFRNNTIGTFNTASGLQALYSNTSGNENTGTGYQALYNNTAGFNNTATGTHSLYSNTEGDFNTASGRQALYSNTDGHFNTASGQQALYSNTTGSNNTGIGRNANVSVGDLNNATAIGANAIVNASNKIQLGDANVTAVATSATVTAAGFVGDGSQLTNLPGDHLGNHLATQTLDMANQNIVNGGTVTAAGFVGDGSQLTNLPVSSELSDADNDTKIQVEESADEDKIRFDVGGTEIGFLDNKTFHLKAPGNSLFIGKNAGINDNGSHNLNVALGSDAFTNNISGANNTAVGTSSLRSNISANANTGCGFHTLFDNTTGAGNTAIGSSALFYNTTGSLNTAIGIGAGTSNTDLTNTTAIGAFATVDASNKIQLGDANVTAVATSGTVTAAGFVGDFQDADNDTKIQVEESADEDKIRFDVAGSEVVTIATDGKVGIGTTSPTEKLHIETATDQYGLLHTDGTVEVGSWVGNNKGYYGTKSNHPLRLFAGAGAIEMADNIAMTGSWLSGDGDDEGIRISNSGNVRIGGIVSSNTHFGITGSNGGDNAFIVDSDANGTPNLSVKSNGSFTVSTVSSNNVINFAVQHDGDILANIHPNNTAFPINVVLNETFKLKKATSSRRYKKNIRPAHLNADVEKFLSLEPKAFQFKGDPGGRFDYGFIAEEVAELGLTNPLAHWEDGQVQSIYFDHIAFYNFAAIKQNYQRINELEKELSAANAKLEKVEALEQQMAELKALLSSSDNVTTKSTASKK